MDTQGKPGKDAPIAVYRLDVGGTSNRPAHKGGRTPPGAARRVHMGINMLSPQLLHLKMAVEDMRTIVECSPQFGHTEESSKRCRQ